MPKAMRLPNGLTYVVDERPGTKKVSVAIAIGIGSAHEKAEEHGLTNLMQETCNGGTTTRTRAQIAEEFAARGAFLSTETNRTNTIFGTTVLARDISSIFPVMADVLRNPAFDADEIKKTKNQIQQLIVQNSQSASTEAQRKFLEMAYAGQSFGRAPEGTKKNITNFTATQIRQQHDKILASANNIVISFSGDIDTAAAEKLVSDYFGDLPSDTPEPLQAYHFTGGDFRKANSNEQLNLNFGFRAPSLQSPERYSSMILKELISGGMSSPLFVEVREKRGLVYSIAAFYYSGSFAISAGTGKGNARELISVSMDVLGSMARHPVSKDDLEKACQRIIRQIEVEYEDANNACEDGALEILRHGQPLDTLELREHLRRVTPQDIQAASAGFLASGDYALAAVGPLDDMPTPEEIKDMMAVQLKGLVIPAAQSAGTTPLLNPHFSHAAAPVAVLSDSDPRLTILPNGMRIVTTERPGSMACGIWVGAGSAHETPDLNGATHANEHMMFKGTSSYGVGAIDKIVENDLGGALNAYTAKDQTAYHFSSLAAENLEQSVDILFEMVLKANLNHEDFDGKLTTVADGPLIKSKGERDVIIEEIKMHDDKIDQHVIRIMDSLAYPNQAQGRAILGTENSLRAMTVEKLKAYRDEYYVPNNMVFSVAGPIKHEDVVAAVEQKFGSLPQVQFPALPTPIYYGGISLSEIKTATLCSVVISAEAVPSTHPDTLAYEAFANILGGDAYARLSQDIVDRKELAANISTYKTDDCHSSLFFIEANVEAENAKPLIAAVYGNIKKLAVDLTEDELAQVKVAMELEALRAIETNEDACNEFGRKTLTAGSPLSATEISAKIQALTIADIRRVAGQVLKSNPTLAAILPEGTDRALFPSQADLSAMRDGKYVISGPKPFQAPSKGPNLAL